MLDRFVSDFKLWVGQPYKEDGDLVDWLLFIGLLTVGTVLWAKVIKEVLD